MPTQEEAQRQLALAQQAYDRGDRLLLLQISLAELTGEASWFGASGGALHADETVGFLLGQIELAGWRLEHVSTAFVRTGSTTSGRIISAGQGEVDKGGVVGHYVFRRVEPPA